MKKAMYQKSILLAILIILTGLSTGAEGSVEFLIENPNEEVLTDHEVKIDIEHRDGMGADFSNIAFHQDGKLPYWVEDFESGESATVWVNVPELVTDSVTGVEMVFGEEVEGDLNPDKTFRYFDDFSEDTGSDWEFQKLLEDRGSGDRFIWEPDQNRLTTDSSNSDWYSTLADTHGDLSLESEGFVVETSTRTDDDDGMGPALVSDGSDNQDLYASMMSNDYEGAGSDNFESIVGWSGTTGTELVDYGQIVGGATGSSIDEFKTVTLRYDGEDEIEAAYEREIQEQTYNEGDLTAEKVGLVTAANSPPAFYDWFLVRSYADEQPEVVSSADGGEHIEAFTETGEQIWEVPPGVDEVDVLVVGGGGAGAYPGHSGRGAGGGGAGGLVFVPGYKVNSDTIELEVGEGAKGLEDDSSGGSGFTASDFTGEDSTFGDLTALGGGGGGHSHYDTGGDGAPGGSGGGGDGSEDPNSGGESQQSTLEGISGEYGFGNPGADAADTEPSGGGGGASEPGQGLGDDVNDGGDGGDGLSQVEIDGETYNFSAIYGTEYGEEQNGEIYFAGGGGASGHSSGGDNEGEGGLGGGADGANSNKGPEDAMPNTGGGGGSGNQDQNDQGAGDGGSGIILVRYEFDPDPSICDRRGPIQECVSNSSHSVSGEEFTLENIFEAESTAVFQALTETASITVSNSTSISGLWQGSFDIQSDDRTRLEAGAQFQPDDGRITIN